VKQIAIYGKGGIGKSTIAANLSAAMAVSGVCVLQVGCDPKQDSTRLLLHGRKALPVLDYIRNTRPEERELKAIMHSGFAGVACVEAGGPEPGVGCAGRGILTAFELMQTLNIAGCDFDVAIYDILGDVVCGGFAMPLRDKYADIVYIVTSGEFMSLYAANNILRGVRNYEKSGARMAGLIFNERGLPNEKERIQCFADAVCLPVIASFPRSPEITEAERLRQPLAEAYPGSILAACFKDLAREILQFPAPFNAQPLPPDDLEAIILGNEKVSARPIPESSLHEGRISAFSIREAALPISTPLPPKQYHSKSVRAHEALQGCAFNGAMHTVMQIGNTAILAHGPRSCAHISYLGMASSALRIERRCGSSFKLSSLSSIQSSEMDENISIFGGGESLERGILNSLTTDPEALFVVTTCAAGIIGDDVAESIEKARASMDKEIPVIPIQTEGDIAGDYMQGIINAMMAVANHYIDRDIHCDPQAVNIVGEKNLAGNTDANFATVKELLQALGLHINCRFLRNCTGIQLRNFMRGRLNLLASADRCGRAIRDFLVDRYQATFLDDPFPIGFEATADWLTRIANIFEKQNEADAVIEHYRKDYEASLSTLRPSLAGKRVFIVTPNYQIDWLLSLITDLDMEIVKLGVLNSAWDDAFATRYEGHFPIELSYTQQKRNEEVHTFAPDLMLTSGFWEDRPASVRIDAIPLVPDVGFFSGLARAERWRRLMQLPEKEGWRYDLS
jgi:nitrogenase iron protein